MFLQQVAGYISATPLCTIHSYLSSLSNHIAGELTGLEFHALYCNVLAPVAEGRLLTTVYFLFLIYKIWSVLHGHLTGLLKIQRSGMWRILKKWPFLTLNCSIHPDPWPRDFPTHGRPSTTTWHNVTVVPTPRPPSRIHQLLFRLPF